MNSRQRGVIRLTKGDRFPQWVLWVTRSPAETLALWPGPKVGAPLEVHVRSATGYWNQVLLVLMSPNLPLPSLWAPLAIPSAVRSLASTHTNPEVARMAKAAAAVIFALGIGMRRRHNFLARDGKVSSMKAFDHGQIPWWT
eukprot:g28297.t1